MSDEKVPKTVYVFLVNGYPDRVSLLAAKPGFYPDAPWFAEERYILASSAEKRLASFEKMKSAIEQLLRENGCECDCEHHYTEHDNDCERCFPCRVQMALTPEKT